MRKRWMLAAALTSLGLVTLAAVPSAKLQSGHTKMDRDAVVTATRTDGASLVRTLLTRYSKTELATGTYVGSEFCLACHTTYNPEVVEWRGTLHSHALRKPMGMYTLEPGKGVLANSLGGPQDDFMMGLDFNQLSGTPFDSRKPNAPILSYDAGTDTYFVQLGPGGLKMPVVATWAGQSEGNGQRFIVRVPVSNTTSGFSQAVYFGPMAWGGTSWSDNSKYWYNGNTPKYAPGVTTAQLGDVTNGVQSQNYMKTCIGCHITGVRKTSVAASGEYIVNPYPASLVPTDSPNYPDIDGDGIPDLTNIGCESCHGPGSAHILGGGDPTKIVNPADISNNQQRSETCLQCHVQVASAPNKVWGFPYDEVNNKPFVMTNPPDPLTQYQVFTGGKWPDGMHYISARIDEYQSSAHYLGSHGIACNDCHNPHAETQNDAQVRDSITRSGVTVPNTNVDDDSFCLGCHGGHFAGVTKQQVVDWKSQGFDAPVPDDVRDAIEAHTHHPYGADRSLGLSSCITCHMAPDSGHGDVGGYSHSFWPAAPEDTITYKDVTGLAYGGTGNVNACASSCHRNQVRIWTDVDIDNSSPSNQFGVGYMNGAAISLAEHLVDYYGPGGAWWDTGSEASASSNKP